MDENKNRYYYQKNIQGDVIGIIALRCYDYYEYVAYYVYDAFGNHKVYDADWNENTSPSFIGNINPIRYRSYYYDVETGFYYLETRYYDPELCRFISPDNTKYLEPATLGGLNLYAYCNNNPVMYADPSGQSVTLIIGLLAASFIVGTGTSIVSQGVTYGWDEINYWQAAIDGLFAAGSTALAMTGIGLGASIGIGAAMGWSQYAIGAAFHNENLTLLGSLTALGIGAIGGAISGPGANNNKSILKSMKSNSKTRMLRILDKIDKYGLDSKQFRHAMDNYGYSVVNEISGIVSRDFKKASIKIMGYTIVSSAL